MCARLVESGELTDGTSKTAAVQPRIYDHFDFEGALDFVPRHFCLNSDFPYRRSQADVGASYRGSWTSSIVSKPDGASMTRGATFRITAVVAMSP